MAISMVLAGIILTSLLLDAVLAEASQSCTINKTCEDLGNPFTSCPAGFICSNSACTELTEVGGKKRNKLKSILKYSDPNSTLTARILDCYCMTYEEGAPSVTVSSCSYNCNPGQPMYVPLGLNYSQLNEIMCFCGGHHRDGEMCKNCHQGHYPTLYSYSRSCTKCKTGKWHAVRHVLIYLAIAYLPLVLLTLVVFLLKINISSSHLHGFVLFSQVVSIPVVIRILLDKSKSKTVYHIIQVFSVIFGVSNLDFFRAYTDFICIKNMSVFEILTLDYIAAALPLAFIFLSYAAVKLYNRNYRLLVLLWYPFQFILLRIRKNWDIKSTMADAYCTFFLLSYMKFLSVSFDFIIPTGAFIVKADGNISTEKRLFYDASSKYFGKEHLPFGLVAIFMLFFFIVGPMLVLFFYQFQWFQKKLFFLPPIFHESVEKFQDCYKNGKGKSGRDYRWFSGMFLILRIVVFISFSVTPTYLYFVLSAIYILVFSLIMLLLQPFKTEYAHYLSVNMFFTTLLSLVYISLAGLKIATVKSQKHVKACYYLAAFFTMFSLIYVSAYAVYWLYSRKRSNLGWKFYKSIYVWKKGYGATVQEEMEGSFPDRIQNPTRYNSEIMGSFVAQGRPPKAKEN